MLYQLEIHDFCLAAKVTGTSIAQSTLGSSDPTIRHTFEIGNSSGGRSALFRPVGGCVLTCILEQGLLEKNSGQLAGSERTRKFNICSRHCNGSTLNSIVLSP